jgi:hypothetical protein
MIISDINHLEVVSESTSVAGATGSLSRYYYQSDNVNVNFNTANSFYTSVNSPKTYSNSAAAGAKGDAINNTHIPSYSYTKADTLAVTELGGGSFSASTSAAVINPIWC